MDGMQLLWLVSGFNLLAWIFLIWHDVTEKHYMSDENQSYFVIYILGVWIVGNVGWLMAGHEFITGVWFFVNLALLCVYCDN